MLGPEAANRLIGLDVSGGHSLVVSHTAHDTRYHLVDNHTPARGIMGLMQPKGKGVIVS